MTDHLTDHPAGADHKIHHTTLDQISEVVTTAFPAPAVVTKADRVLDRNLTHRLPHFNQGTTGTKTGSRTTKETDTMAIKETGLTNEGDPPNLITADQHQRHR